MKYNKQHSLVKFGIYTLSETMDKSSPETYRQFIFN